MTDILISLCRILSSLHKEPSPIVHRDIKPSNILMRSDGTIVLLDLNASRTVKTNVGDDTHHLGTAGYAAPEQYGFGQSTPRSDIYALGIPGKYGK